MTTAFVLFMAGVLVIVFSALVLGAPWYIWLGVSLILSAVIVDIRKIMNEGD